MWRPSDTYSAQFFAKIISGDNRERSVFIIGCNQFFTYGAIVREAVAKKGTPGARVSAAIALLDRGYGKPPQFNAGDAQAFRQAVDMPDDELAAIVGRAKLTVV